MSVAIHVRNVVKQFDRQTIIPDLSVDIANGEFFTLLGPSGCGKTTLLRMIAGFNSIEAGQIDFDGARINDIPAHRRNIGMVFQNYAIFPHMTVRANVEYGLKLRKTDKVTMKRRVDEILDTVRIREYQDRLPEKLSGGQQQRVALARAIVIHPSVLLMDEPLSNLDAKLRVEMRAAIRDIQKAVGITTVYVTHDQEEALAVSDRIAVMKGGVIQHLGRPEEIYTRPANLFTATFIGHSNLFHGTIENRDGRRGVRLTSQYAVALDNLSPEAADGQQVLVSVRPEEFLEEADGMPARIRERTFLGRYANYAIDADSLVRPGDAEPIAYTPDLSHGDRIHAMGESIRLGLNPRKINVLTADGETNLTRGA